MSLTIEATRETVRSSPPPRHPAEERQIRAPPMRPTFGRLAARVFDQSLRETADQLVALAEADRIVDVFHPVDYRYRAGRRAWPSRSVRAAASAVLPTIAVRGIQARSFVDLRFPGRRSVSDSSIPAKKDMAARDAASAQIAPPPWRRWISARQAADLAAETAAQRPQCHG